jgi:hypothetical protein
VFAQYCTVLLRLILLQPVTYHHRLAAEHLVYLLNGSLEQGPGVLPGGLLIGAFGTFSPENQLEHRSFSPAHVFFHHRRSAECEKCRNPAPQTQTIEKSRQTALRQGFASAIMLLNS